MKQITATALLCAGMVVGASAQEQKPAQPDSDAMMKQWKVVSTPGENHRKLEFFVGKWRTESTVWTMGPGTEPAVTKGSSEKQMVLGGRFLEEEFSGELMGMRMTGLGLTGYDNFAKKYVSFWFDDMNTTVATMEGTFDREGKVLTMYGKADEWMTGELGKTIKYVTRIVSPESSVLEIHDMSSGELGTKVIEVRYTRKQ